jgi:hypothetical protein
MSRPNEQGSTSPQSLPPRICGLGICGLELVECSRRVTVVRVHGPLRVRCRWRSRTSYASTDGRMRSVNDIRDVHHIYSQYTYPATITKKEYLLSHARPNLVAPPAAHHPNQV